MTNGICRAPACDCAWTCPAAMPLHEPCVAALPLCAANGGYVSHKITNNLSKNHEYICLKKTHRQVMVFRQKDSSLTDSMCKRKQSRQTAAHSACGATHGSWPHLRMAHFYLLSFILKQILLSTLSSLVFPNFMCCGSAALRRPRRICFA